MRSHTQPSLPYRSRPAAWAFCPFDGRVRRGAQKAGDIEHVQQTVVFAERYSLPGGPLATNRYRR
jgi:hypothetical protein